MAEIEEIKKTMLPKRFSAMSFAMIMRNHIYKNYILYQNLQLNTVNFVFMENH